MPEQGGDGAVEVLRSATATMKRDGVWKVSPSLRVESLTGAVKLDFRTAVLPGDAIDIEVKSGTGAVDLILPEGATADVSGLTQGTGHIRCAAHSGPTPGHPHFVLHGLLGTGGVRIDYRPKLLGLF